MWIVARLRNQDLTSSFYKVMASNIPHDLCARIDLRVQLLLELMQGLRSIGD